MRKFKVVELCRIEFDIEAETPAEALEKWRDTDSSDANEHETQRILVEDVEKDIDWDPDEESLPEDLSYLED